MTLKLGTIKDTSDLIDWRQSTCCDFHCAPEDVERHRAEMAAEYGRTQSGETVSAPEGWRVIPFGDPIPREHREYVEGVGWASVRRGHSTMTPMFARPFGLTRAYAGRV